MCSKPFGHRKQKERRRKIHTFSQGHWSVHVSAVVEDGAPTSLSGGFLIGRLTAHMLPCELVLTKTDCLKHHTAHGASGAVYCAGMLQGDSVENTAKCCC